MDKAICAALGLPETATEAEALAAVAALKTSLNAAQAKPQTVDLTAYAPRADVNAMEARAVAAENQLSELNAVELKRETEAAVDQAIKDRKIAPASREQYVAMCATKDGLEGFKKTMAVSPAVFDEAPQVPAGAPPSSQTSLNAEETAMAKSLGYSEEEWKKLKEASK
jgi:phage I-like protein